MNFQILEVLASLRRQASINIKAKLFPARPSLLHKVLSKCAWHVQPDAGPKTAFSRFENEKRDAIAGHFLLKLDCSLKRLSLLKTWVSSSCDRALA